jgi:hypothetical protein
VVRGAEGGENHGGLCVVDFAERTIRYAIEWNTTDIDVAGRGGDRGLRGVALVGDDIYVLSNKALLRFDADFALICTFHNQYLKHCHELSIHNGRAYIVSTGYDSILTFDLSKERFIAGHQLVFDSNRLRLRLFNPQRADGPVESNVFHLNSVKCNSSGLYFSGLRTDGLLRTTGSQFGRAHALPRGTHNAQPFLDGLVYNDTVHDRFCARSGTSETLIPVTLESGIEGVSTNASKGDVARPLFARGLCPLSSRYVAGGSSPSTVSLYDLVKGARVAQMTLSRDVRNAIHGLALWTHGDDQI